MADLRVPKLNNNDVTYTLVEWLADEGQQLRAGDAVAVVETSKAAEELTCDADGALHRLLAVGQECEVGQVIGRLGGVGDDPPGPPPEQPVAAGQSPDGMVITAPAQALIDATGVSLEALRRLGLTVIKRADVARVIAATAGRPSAPEPGETGAPREETGAPREETGAPREEASGPGELTPLSRAQQAVAAVVTQSHRSIPTAFVAVKVPLDAALATARALTKQHRCLIGLPELLVTAIAQAYREFPLFFAEPVGDAAVRVPAAAQVGVTIDVGRGLQVPVVRDAALRSLPEVAKTMMAIRLTALRGTFQAHELTGANIMLALHVDDGVTLAVPIVFPGQTCAVSLGAVHSEIDLDDDGRPVRVAVAQLGVAYDHRVINGRDAVLFAQHLATTLRSGSVVSTV